MLRAYALLRRVRKTPLIALVLQKLKIKETYYLRLGNDTTAPKDDLKLALAHQRELLFERKGQYVR